MMRKDRTAADDNVSMLSAYPEFESLKVEAPGERQRVLEKGLSRFFYNDENLASDILTMLEANGFIFGNGGFVLMLITLWYDQRPGGGFRNPDEDYGRLVKLASRELSAHCLSYVAEVNGCIVALACFNRAPEYCQEQLEACQTRCLEACRRILKSASNSRGPEIKIYISNMFFESRRIKKAFFQLESAYNYQVFMGNTADFPDLTEVLYEDRPIYADVETLMTYARRFSAALRNDDEGEISAVHDGALDFLLYSKPQSMYHVRHRVDLFVSFLISELESKKRFFTPNRVGVDILIPELCFPDDAVSMKEGYSKLITSIARSSVVAKSWSPSALHRSVKNFVMKNIMNPGLTIEEISAEFKVSKSTLSAQFKQRSGESLGDYIHKLRLQVACEFLRETNMDVKSVAEMSGYGSVATMHRSFRKYLDTTPGRFRSGQG